MMDNIFDVDVLESLSDEELKKRILSASDEELSVLFYMFSLLKKRELYEKVSIIILEDEVCKLKKALLIGKEMEYISYLNIFGKLRLFVFLSKRNNVYGKKDFLNVNTNDRVLLELLYKEIESEIKIEEFGDIENYLDDLGDLYH